LAWFNYPKSISIKLWGTALLSLVLCFALFYAKKPEVWKEGIQYHNHAAVDEWKGYGDPPVSYSMERGIHFAKHLKAVFAGDMQQRVFKARIVQASVMLGMLAFGLGLFYFVGKKHRKSVDPLHFSLLFLYGFVWAFYFFGPLTYRYYLIAPLLLSAVITSMVWTGKTAEGQAGS
jgi:hypothetical protein